MLTFCPICANVLVVEEGPKCLRFACNTCPYIQNITRKISHKKYPKLKEVDDVLGGAEAWENVDSTQELYETGSSDQSNMFLSLPYSCVVLHNVNCYECLLKQVIRKTMSELMDKFLASIEEKYGKSHSRTANHVVLPLRLSIQSKKETCPKCDHPRAFFMQMQTRSADEPMTTFYKCCNMSCGHRWRDSN